MPVMGAIGDGGAFRSFEHQNRPRIATRYYPDDGYHAVQVETGDFDPLYWAGSYLILVTGTVRDAVVSRPALFAFIGDGGRFGMVDRVTAEAVHLRSVRLGRDESVVARDRVEMVYVPVGRVGVSGTAGTA